MTWGNRKITFAEKITFAASKPWLWMGAGVLVLVLALIFLVR